MKSKYNIWLSIGFIVLIALLLRLFLVEYEQCIETDGVAYVKIAKEIIKDKTLTHKFYPPGYPFFIGLASFFTNNYELAGRTISAIFGALLIVPVFLICKQIYGKRLAFWTSLLIAFYPPLVEFSTKVLTESSFTFFVISFIWLSLLAMKTNQSVFFLTAGVFLGISYLIRPEGIGFLPYLICAYLIRYFKTNEVTKSLLAKNLIGFVIASMIFILPYMVLVGGISGKTQYQLAVWSKTVGKANVVRARDEMAQDYDESQDTSLIKEFLNNPASMIKRCVMNLHLVHKYVIPELFFPIILVMLGIGLIRIKFEWDEIYIFLIWLPYTVVLFMLVDARFFLPLVPIFLIIAILGISFLSKLISRKWKILSPSIISLIVLGLILLSLLPFTFRPIYRPDENVIYRKAGVWMKNNLTPPLKIMDRKPYLTFYSEGKQLKLPVGRYDEVIKYARENSATHLVIDNKLIPELRPELSFLISTEYTPDDLNLLKTFNFQNKRLLIYEILYR